MNLRELWSTMSYHSKWGGLWQADCMDILKQMDDNCVDLLLTDIPYDGVNKSSNGLRTIDKGTADIITFDLNKFLDECYRVTKGTIIIFCGHGQMSSIYTYFDQYSRKNKGTTRQLIWQKTNPSPMNGQYIYLSGIENAIWFKKRGGVFNAHCKNTVFTHPSGRSKLHPTEKNHALLKELIEDNSNEGDIVFDPCCGSGSHCLVAMENRRKFLGVELNEEYYNVAKERMEALV